MDKWVSISKEADKELSINVNGLATFLGEDFFVWASEEYNTPIEVDGLEKEVSKIKSYFLIHKEKRRYSLVEIIYYDKKNNVITSYRYNREYTQPEFKYSNPISKDSDMEKIFDKSMEIINSASK